MDDRELDFPMYPKQASCATCDRYKEKYKCEAYPNSIPSVILNGSNDHFDSYLNDNGLRYKSK